MTYIRITRDDKKHLGCILEQTILRGTPIKLIPAFLLHSTEVWTSISNNVFSTCFGLLLAARMPLKKKYHPVTQMYNIVKSNGKTDSEALDVPLSFTTH